MIAQENSYVFMTWDMDRQCYVDEMGFPASITELKDAIESLTRALSIATPEKLAQAARDMAEERYSERLEHLQDSHAFSPARYQ